jgi:hypothetical protein
MTDSLQADKDDFVATSDPAADTIAGAPLGDILGEGGDPLLYGLEENDSLINWDAPDDALEANDQLDLLVDEVIIDTTDDDSLFGDPSLWPADLFVIPPRLEPDVIEEADGAVSPAGLDETGGLGVEDLFSRGGRPADLQLYEFGTADSSSLDIEWLIRGGDADDGDHRASTHDTAARSGSAAKPDDVPPSDKL